MANEPKAGGAPARPPGEEAARNLEGGYAIIMRRIYEHPAFRNEHEASVFIWMVLRAQWKPYRFATRWGAVTLEAGDLLFAERDVSTRFNMHRNTLRSLIQRMVAEGLITALSDRSPYHAGTVYRVNKYQIYQSVTGASSDVQDRSETDAGTNAGPIEGLSRTKKNQGNQGKRITATRGGRPPKGATEDPADMGEVVRDAMGQLDAITGEKAPDVPKRQQEPGDIIPPQGELLGAKVVALPPNPVEEAKGRIRLFLKRNSPRITDGRTYELCNSLLRCHCRGEASPTVAVCQEVEALLARWLEARMAGMMSEALEPYLRGVITQQRQHGHEPEAPRQVVNAPRSRFGFAPIHGGQQQAPADPFGSGPVIDGYGEEAR